VDFHLAYSPERVLPGQILRELIENARVIGGVTPESAQAGRDLVLREFGISDNISLLLLLLNKSVRSIIQA